MNGVVLGLFFILILSCIMFPPQSDITHNAAVQGYSKLHMGKCRAQGTLAIALSQRTKITHVTLDHVPRYNSTAGRIDAAPKDFEIYGMKNSSDRGTQLGTFTFEEYGETTQTFKLTNTTNEVYKIVELHVLSNWGQPESTCLYGFRVHGQKSSPDGNRNENKFSLPSVSVVCSMSYSNPLSFMVSVMLFFSPSFSIGLSFHFSIFSIIPTISVRFVNVM